MTTKRKPRKKVTKSDDPQKQLNDLKKIVKKLRKDQEDALRHLLDEE